MTKRSADLLNDYHLLSYDELDSTNEEAKRLARGGGAHGAVIWAKKQTAGKGRMGREWVSQDGNLFVSFLLSPGCAQAALPQLSFVASVAAHEALSPLLSPACAIACKWPNDILINDRKVAGILLESFLHEGKMWAVVGIGVNIETFPKHAIFPATSLHEAGVEIVSAKIVLSRLIHTFIECYNAWNQKGLAPIRRSWARYAWGIGKQVKVMLPNEELEGVFKELDADGALVLQIAPRKKRVIHAGDIFPLEAAKEEA